MSPLGLRSQAKTKEMRGKLSPIENAKLAPNTVSKMNLPTLPWNTKKYRNNNSSTIRSGNEDSMGIFPAKRRSLGASSPKPDRNAKAGTFAFGAKVESGRSVTVKP